MKKRGKLILGIIQLFVAIGALPAGYLLLAEPDGHGIGNECGYFIGFTF